MTNGNYSAEVELCGTSITLTHPNGLTESVDLYYEGEHHVEIEGGLIDFQPQAEKVIKEVLVKLQASIETKGLDPHKLLIEAMYSLESGNKKHRLCVVEKIKQYIKQ
ncbi:MAG: hypothetical protein HAW67_01295 [Endozoicomonadaceae bacterium]|nr:hypothetical protein [Endozoicomonadaceae bacterium]